jgi:hypothetical protein
MTLPIYELKISENLQDDAQVDYIALVDAPAIKKDFLAFNDQLSIYGFTPKYFYLCPMATKLFQHLVDMNVGINEQGMLRSAGQIADNILGIEYYAIENKIVSIEDYNEAVLLLDDFIDLMAEIDKLIGMNHDVSFMQNHINTIKSFLPKGLEFAETYNDYPEQAKENAKIALRWADENGWGDCGTEVGKIRANQLAKGENISRDTIARMSGFERHRQNSQKELGDGCGRLMWLAWGGDAGVEWATRKLAQIDKTKLSFSIISEEKRIISGALMLADELIYRNNEKMGEHYVKFSADTIKMIAIKFAKKKYQNNVNLMHDPSQKVKGVTMFESWLVDTERGIMPMKGFEGVADGSWFGSFYVENEKVWQSIKKGDYKGFSVEGLFDYVEPISAEENALKKIGELLNSIIEE